MLEKIIKRNGSIEDFIPSKLNKWSQWASKDLQERVDWSSIVLNTVKSVGKQIQSQELQRLLIKNCVRMKNWAYQLMAGRLYASLYRKELYGDKIPTVQKLHRRMQSVGLMTQLNYSDDDYAAIELLIDHDRDFNMAYFQIEQIRKKYAIKDLKSKMEYETPQFVYMRMAIALAEHEPQEMRLHHIKQWYDHFSFNRINAPTPNFINLGTRHNGYSSCCLYSVKDTAASLAVGDHIAYTMTYMSAGIGGVLHTRSITDPVRGGIIEHQGKLPYYRSLAGAVKANLQGGRGGACTSYFTCYDPEVMTLIMLQNPRTPVDRQNRDIHFAMLFNYFIVKKAALNEPIFTFNAFTAPELYEAFYHDDREQFERLYLEKEQDPKFKKNYLNARDILITAAQQSHEVATFYFAQIDEINRHTSFKETIYSSNLCVEITQPTKPYDAITQLYDTEHIETGEVSLCSLAGINVAAIKTDEEYESAAYYALKMIDVCIHKSDYVLPQVGQTALARMNAGVGMIGLAYALAKKGIPYNCQAGLEEIHRISERHAYFVIKASLKLGQELGNAPWIHKTKWPEGWLPIDTYKKSVDTIVAPKYQYDWEGLRKAIIENKGIRNSSLIAHMPTESSSKASGVPNGVYPIRDLNLKKTDAKNVLEWCATDNDLLEYQYQIAWELNFEDMAKVYAVIQKFTDQSISADFYRDRSLKHDLTTDELLNEFITMAKYGIKTKYYQNSYTLEAQSFSENKIECAGGCTL